MNGEPHSRTRRHHTGRLGHEHGNATLAAIGGVAVGVIVVLLIWLVMDADRNGIPCETVYPAATVDAFWYS